MIVIFHVFAALLSIAVTSFTYFKPTAVKLRVSYGLIATTLASGFYLVFTAPAHMAEVCTMGLFYVAVVSVGTVAARGKLARLERAKVEV